MDAIERHVTLPTDLAGAWELLTRPEDQAGWLGAEVDLAPVEGAPGLVVDHDGTRRRLVVDEVEAGRRLAWTWWVEGEDADADVQANEVEVTLAPTFDGTLVTITERPLTTAARAAATTTASGAAWSHRTLHLEVVLLSRAAVLG